MGKKNKRITYSKDLKEPEKKTIQNVMPESYDEFLVSWRFYRIKSTSQTKWRIDQDNWNVWSNNILPKLMNFESYKWSQIKRIPKPNGGGSMHHNIARTKLSPSAQREIRELGLEYDEFFSLRLSGKERVFGILDRGVLELLWYDKEHEICPVLKKHT